MISRQEAVSMINNHLDVGTRKEKSHWHYGRVELAELLDAIYGLPDPKKLEEHLLAR